MASSKNQTPEGTASGYVSLNGVKINLNHVYALAQQNAFDEKKLDIAVLLTEKPISEGELKDVVKLEHAAHSRNNYALFKINDQGKPIHEVIEHPVLKNNRLVMSGFTWAQFVSKVLSKERIEGSFKTKAETDFGGYKYEISVKFNAQIQQAKLPEPLPDAKTGKALPPDGGDPAKAYLVYREAIEKKDIAAMRKLFQPPAGVEVTDDEIKESLEFMASAVPKNLKITKGYINIAGDRAVVYFTGTEEGQKLYGTIGIIRKDNVWMVTEELWSEEEKQEKKKAEPVIDKPLEKEKITVISMSREEYDTFFSKRVSGIDSESDYQGPHTYAGPALIAFDDSWGLNIALPVIPNIEDNKDYVWIDLTSVVSKDGKDVLDKESSFEKDIFFKGLTLFKKTQPFDYLFGRRSIHKIFGAKSSDIKTIKGTLFFKIPLDSKNSNNFHEKSYPFTINI